MHGIESCTLNGMEIALAFIYTFLPIVLLLALIVCGADLLDWLLRRINKKLNKLKK